MDTGRRSIIVMLLGRLWASLTSFSRVGPGPRTLAAITAIGLTMKLLAEPLTSRKACRPTIAKRKRKRLSEYRRDEDPPTACMTTGSHENGEPVSSPRLCERALGVQYL